MLPTSGALDAGLCTPWDFLFRIIFPRIARKAKDPDVEQSCFGLIDDLTSNTGLKWKID